VINMPKNKPIMKPSAKKAAKNKMAVLSKHQAPSKPQVSSKPQIYEMPAAPKKEQPAILQNEGQSAGKNSEFVFDGREKLITTFTAGGVILSFCLYIGSIMLVPVWPMGAGLVATLGIISFFGAFMARETL
jgi:hypothetical protein